MDTSNSWKDTPATDWHPVLGKKKYFKVLHVKEIRNKHWLDRPPGPRMTLTKLIILGWLIHLHPDPFRKSVP